MRNIVTTYHHGFAGGSKNTSRLLRSLSTRGYNIRGYFFKEPDYFTTRGCGAIDIALFRGIDSEVIAPEFTNTYSAAEQIVQGIAPNEDLALFGANLFPYCNILHDVKSQVARSVPSYIKLMLHPVGSDVWQIGPRLKTRVSWLLDSPLVDSLFTYSSGFADEIREYYNVKRDIQVLPPVIDTGEFCPLPRGAANERRRSLGISEESYIIHHHSSMRKIKCPEVVIEIARKVSQIVPRQCILVMSGPVPQEVIARLKLHVRVMEGRGRLGLRSQEGNLTIYWTGVQADVTFLLQISDVELNASLHDSFNIALLEAMACGIPVVSSDVVGISEHICRAKAGICFPTTRLNFDDLNRTLASGDSKSDLFDIDDAVSALTELACSSGGFNTPCAAASYVRQNFGISNAFEILDQHLL